MAAEKKKARGLVKKTVLSALSGLAFCLILSLAAAALTAKAEKALSLEGAAAAFCVFGGALFTAALGAKLTGAAAGLYSGASFTAALVLLSLCFGEGTAHPLPLFSAAAAGVLTGILMFGKRKSGAKKQLRRYVKKR